MAVTEVTLSIFELLAETNSNTRAQELANSSHARKRFDSWIVQSRGPESSPRGVTSSEPSARSIRRRIHPRVSVSRFDSRGPSRPSAEPECETGIDQDGWPRSTASLQLSGSRGDCPALRALVRDAELLRGGESGRTRASRDQPRRPRARIMPAEADPSLSSPRLESAARSARALAEQSWRPAEVSPVQEGRAPSPGLVEGRPLRSGSPLPRRCPGGLARAMRSRG